LRQNEDTVDGHKGYIGAVVAPILRSAGHEVVGLDVDLFAGCEFGEAASEIPEVRKDIRDLAKADLRATSLECRGLDISTLVA
jgi:nucleoside-diphosphate-sugar epimerase